MPKTDAFEKYSDKYDQWFEKNSAFYQSELKAIASLMPESHLGLEIGMGSGKFADPLGIAAGVDPSNEMLKKAGEKISR